MYCQQATMMRFTGSSRIQSTRDPRTIWRMLQQKYRFRDLSLTMPVSFGMLTCDVKTTDLSCTVLSNRIRGTKNTIIAKVANCSPLPLLSGQTVTAGLYASLTDTEPIAGSSLVEIPVNDLYSNSTPLTKVIQLQVENLPKDQQAFIKVIVNDGAESVTDVKPENNYVPVPLYAEDGNIITIPGDVNRDMNITIADVTALVNIILGK